MNPVGAKMDLARFAFATEYLKNAPNDVVADFVKRFTNAVLTGTEVEWLNTLGVQVVARGR